MSDKPDNPIDDRGQHGTQAATSNEWELSWTSPVLAHFSQPLLKANTLEAILETISGFVRPARITGITVLVFSGSPHDQFLQVAAAWARKRDPALAVGYRISAQEHLVQTIRTAKQPMAINDITAWERAGASLRSLLLQAHIKAVIVVPLGPEEDRVGALLFDRSENGPLDRETVRACKDIAALACEPIVKLWRIKENELALANTSALYNISQRLLQAQSIGEILQNVVDSELFGAAGGTIALLEPSTSAPKQTSQELVFRAAAGAGADKILGLRMPISEGVIGWVVRENKPAIVPDAYADERFYHQIDREINFRTQSILCVPLRVEEHVIGAIELVGVYQEALSEQGIRLLVQVADQAALLIENQRLLHQTKSQAQELSMLLEVSHTLTSTLDIDETLDLISSRVLDLVRADGCHVFMVQIKPNGESVLKPVVSSDRYAEQILNTSLEIGQGITGRVVQSGIGVIANRVDLDPHGYLVPDTPREPENLISVPLISGGHVVGAMTVSRMGEKGFVENDLNVVSAMASQAATALEKARLYTEAQQRSQELAVLNAVASTASQSLSLGEILRSTLEQVTGFFPGTSGLICLRNPVTGELHPSEHLNVPHSVLQRFEEDGLRGTMCDVTVTSGQTYLEPDLSLPPPLSPSVQQADRESLLREGLRGYLGTPLIAHGQILGTLSVFSREPNTFVRADADLLTAMGKQIGIAVRNAQLHERTERALDESILLYEASQAISNTLELEDVLEITANRMAEYVRADRCQIVLLDEALVNVQVMAEYPLTPRAGNALVPVAGNPAYEFLRDKSEPVAIKDVESHPLTRGHTDSLIGHGAKSMLLLPLIVQRRLIGAVELYTTQTHRGFTVAEINFCRTLADRAALAVENRRLFSQTFYTLQETTLLYQASRALTQAQDLRDVMQAITNNLPVKHIDQCWIALEDVTNRTIEIKAIWDHEGDHTLLGRRLLPRELPLVSETATAQTWVVNDLDDQSDLDAYSVATLRALGVKSALMLPLIIGEAPLGWLVLLTHHASHVFDPDQIRLYEALADQASVVIQNQQLLRKVQDSLKEVETAHHQYLRGEWMRFLQSKDKRLTSVVYDQDEPQTPQNSRHTLRQNSIIQGTPVTHISDAEIGRGRGPAEMPGGTIRQAENPDEGRDGSSLITPLKVRGQVIGALGLEDPEGTRPWTAEEISMVREIADRVAQAVENARLLEETQTSLAETERLYHVTSRLSNTDTAAEALRILAEEFQVTLAPAYSGNILSAGPDPADRIDWLALRAQWNAQGTEMSHTVRFAISDYPVLSRLVGHREPLLIEDTDVVPQGAPPWMISAQNEPRTILTIPLISGGRWLGIINIFGQHKSVPDSRTMRFLKNLADRAAVALDSARLYAETQQRAIHLEAAAKVSRAATSILEQEKLLSSVVELIRDHFDYYHAQVFLLDPTERWAVLRASIGEPGRKLLKHGHSLEVGGDSLIGYVTSTGEPGTTYDVQTDSRQTIYPLLSDTRSELAIPLKIGGRVIGALDVHSIEPIAFSSDEIAVLSTLADQLAVAIENARLYQEQLETAKKLREVDRLKTQFLANMSHELRTPLNSIIGFSRVILKGIDGPVTDLQRQDLTAIYSSGQLLLQLINDILDLSKIEAGKMELVFAETDLYELIHGVVATTMALVKEKPQVELRQNVAPDLPLILADATRLRQVLLNLLSNAVKFTEEGFVDLSVTHDSRSVTFQVSDTGIGIPADKFDLIFQEFQQVDGSSARAAGGTGLGLPISKYLVEMHGGCTWVESTIGVGSTFTVQIPVKGPQAAAQVKEEAARTTHQSLNLAINDDTADQPAQEKEEIEE